MCVNFKMLHKFWKKDLKNNLDNYGYEMDTQKVSIFAFSQKNMYTGHKTIVILKNIRIFVI